MCGERGAVVKDAGLQVTLLDRSCHSWDCPTASRAMKRRVANIFRAGAPTITGVLTIKVQPGMEPDEAADTLHRNLSILIRRIRRDPRWRWHAYAWVIERHKSGFPHMHFLARGAYVDQKWLSQQWQDLTGSPVVWIEYIRSRTKHVKYLTKYLTKDATKFGNHKRWHYSQNWIVAPDEIPEVFPDAWWTPTRTQRWQLRDLYTLYGYLIMQDDACTVLRAPPGGGVDLGWRGPP